MVGSSLQTCTVRSGELFLESGPLPVLVGVSVVTIIWSFPLEDRIASAPLSSPMLSKVPCLKPAQQLV